MKNKDIITALLRSKAFLLPVALLGGYVVFAQVAAYTENSHAKNTYLKTFYAQAALADKHIQELRYPNFVVQAPVEETQTGRHRSFVKYCSPPGSYHNYQTGETINGARTCTKGAMRFYWLPTLDSETIDKQIADLQMQGWQLTDPDTQLQKQNILVRHESNRGFNFTRSDGTNAILAYWDREGHDASGGQGWCGYDPGCAKLKAADNSHRYFMSISIYAYKGYED